MCPVVTRKKCVTKGLQCVSVSVITTVCCCFWSFCPLRAKAKCLTFQLSLNKKINYNWEECENVKRLPCCYLFASTGNYKNYKLVKQLAPARQEFLCETILTCVINLGCEAAAYQRFKGGGSAPDKSMWGPLSPSKAYFSLVGGCLCHLQNKSLSWRPPSCSLGQSTH